MESKIRAEIIADSINSKGKRITTFVLEFPRIVLSEFNTHRMISKNSASSRAIPLSKIIKSVKENPFIPSKWLKSHTGMQGFEEISDINQKNAITEWLLARDNAIKHAIQLDSLGVTKQICNRLLEPFLCHKCICTGTEWENFFALRAHPDAEIHIQELAHKMLDAYNQSKPKQLKAGEWHIPFGDKIEPERLIEYGVTFCFANNGWNKSPTTKEISDYITRVLYKKIATARCARVSYLNFEGKDDYEADIKLHDQLVKSGHMSPFEHCAQNREDTLQYGNFIGWKQYRKQFKNENKTDERVIK